MTSDVTLHAARLQADHLLRGYEAVALRLMQTIAARVAPDAVDRALDHALAQDARGAARDDAPAPPPLSRGAVPAAAGRDRGAGPPHAGGADRRDRAADRRLPATPQALDAELAVVQHALAADGLARVAYGELADLRWQVATFGFHLASLEVRQHAAVHRAALAALDAGAGPDTRPSAAA